MRAFPESPVHLLMDNVLLSLFVRNPKLEEVAKQMLADRRPLPEVDAHMLNLGGAPPTYEQRIPFYLAYLDLSEKGMMHTVDRCCRIEALRAGVGLEDAAPQVASAFYLRALSQCM